MEPQVNTPLYATTGDHHRRVSGTMYKTLICPPIPIPNSFLIGTLLTSGASPIMPMVPMYKQIALMMGHPV